MASNWFIRNWFLVGLVLAVSMAWIFPEGGARGGLLPVETLTRGGVVVIFFLQGLTLASEQIWGGLVRWRLHLLIQGFIFVGAPVLALSLVLIFRSVLPADLAIGFIFLGALPTTISSALVFTTLAGGNVTLALVNTTIANIAGVLLTPLWVSFFVRVQGESISLGPVILKVALLILLPLVVGQILRRWLHRAADARKKQFAILSSCIVLFIVYSSFSDSVVSGFWVQTGLRLSLGAVGLVLLYFALVMGTVLLIARLLRLGPSDQPAVVFCASQKTLAAGVPMATLIFGAGPALGLILLPVMLYHPLQLLVGGTLIGRYQKANESGS